MNNGSELEPRYYELSEFRWPERSQPDDLLKIDTCLAEGKNLAFSVAEVIISGVDELLPTQRVITRHRGLFNDVGDALFLYIQPAIAFLDAQSGQATMLDRVPPKLQSILDARRQLYEIMRRIDHKAWVQAALAVWEEEEKPKVLAVEEWWRLEQITLDKLKDTKDDPLRFINRYTVARVRFLTRSGIPQIKIQALERGCFRFRQDLTNNLTRTTTSK
ncbi:MAG: hypothetical protein PHV63_03015 [Candidatus Daviesbacteria bacterium]|nr:hypothetical protein [Candidatus Daviesbacteria bacterium]